MPTPATGKTGAYDIVISAATVSNANYSGITFTKGMLTVSTRPVYSAPTYKPTIEDTTGGDVEVSDPSTEKDDTVVITIEPEPVKEVDTVVFTDENGKPVEVIDNGDGT